MPKRPALLLVSTSHGEPPTRLRLERSLELSRNLGRAGLDVDHLILIERQLLAEERDHLGALRESARRVVCVDAPGRARGWRALTRRVVRGVLGTRYGTLPLPFVATLRDWLRCREYRAVIARGDPLRGVAALVDGRVPTLFDIARWRPTLREHLRRHGREDALESSEFDRDPLRGLDAFGAVIVPSAMDAAAVHAAGLGAPLLVCPPIAQVADEPIEPPRPPRILFVGSETVENLDAIRWFRHRILPDVLRAAPSCRFRVVGESARHVTPGLDVDRIGWVDDLAREYRNASVVVLPLRLACGLRRRVVEACAHGRALAVSAEIAAAVEIVSGVDAVVGGDATDLARGIARTLTVDSERRRLEQRSRELAATRFSPERVIAPLLDHLGLAGVRDPSHELRSERNVTVAIP